MIYTGILLVSMVLLLSAIPFIDTAEAQSRKITGYVLDDSDAAISNVRITLFDPDTGEIRTTTTDSNGYFSVTAPGPGHYLISYSHSRYLTPTNPAQVDDRDLYLGFIHLTRIQQQDAWLTGQIRDADGSAARQAYVYLIDTYQAHDGQDIFGQPAANMFMTRADTSGSFTFGTAYEGTFLLMARIGSSRYYFGNSTTVTLVPGANTQDLTYDDWARGRSINVIPLNSNNEQITNAEIIFFDASGNMWNSTIASPGAVRVPDGTYDLIVRAPGFQTHIEQFVVDRNRHYQITMVESQNTVMTTDVTFNHWNDVTYHSSVETRFDHGAYFRSNEYGILATGIIRYDVERFFGNGDGVLTQAEEDAYEHFLGNTIGPDGRTTGSAFRIDGSGSQYEYQNYAVAFTGGTTDVRSTDTVTFEFSYDLTAIVASMDLYRVHYTLGRHVQPGVTRYLENATFTLPQGFEITWRRTAGTYVIGFDEDDTTVVRVDGIGSAEFHCKENILPTPVIRMSDDFMPGDGIYLYRADEYIEFNGTSSYDGSPFGKIMAYHWTFDNVGRSATNDTATAVRKFDEGTYNVTLRVTDNAGGIKETTIQFIVDGTAPDVDFTAEPAMVEQGRVENDATRVFLNITTLFDLNGIKDKFHWDFGDGNSLTIVNFDDRNVTYHYRELNISMLTAEKNVYRFNVTLTVWDRAGHETVVQRTVDVKATELPEAMFEISDDLDPHDGIHVFPVGQEITFNASLSKGTGSDIVTYTWNFGDGSPEVHGVTLNHSFAAEGIYNVILTIRNEDGATDDYNMTIHIDGTPPTVVIGIEGAWEDQGWFFVDQMHDLLEEDRFRFIVNANGTMDGGPVGPLAGLYNFSWSFEEPDKPGFKGLVAGNLSNLRTDYFFSRVDSTARNITLENRTHYYYTISLTVWDFAGHIGRAELNIIVNDTEEPISRFTYIDDIDQGTTIELNGTTSTDNIGVVGYEWIIYFPNGTRDVNARSTDPVYNYTVTETGQYKVVLNVTDAAGNNDTHDSFVTVNRVPRPDLEVTSDGISFSKDVIRKGDRIEVIAQFTNVGDVEAWNVTIQFFHRKTKDGAETHIGDFVFEEPVLAPMVPRIANVSWKATESGQIVVRVKLEGDDALGRPQVEENLDNNEAFVPVLVEKDDEGYNRTLIVGIIAIFLILACAGLIFFYKPEWIGITPPKSKKAAPGKKQRK